MIPQIQSWEFLFSTNLILVFIFPFLVQAIRRKNRHATIFITLLFFLPHILGLIENICGTPADLEFFLILATLHWTISSFALYLLLSSSRRVRSYYAIVFGSGILSAAYPLVSSTLIFNNIFWGIIPGTITIDPMISLNPYYMRLGFFIVTIAFFVVLRKNHSLLWMPLVLAFIFSAPFSTSLSSAKDWPIFASVHFEHTKSPPPEILLYRTENSHQEISNMDWQKALDGLHGSLTAKLPKQFQIKPHPPFKIFIYESDDEKADWVGARKTQIGNFVRGEMHLSDISPSSDVLSHELAHLLHGALNVERKSFLDPFWFEGFAVAMSEDPELLLERAAAIHENLQISGGFEWPTGLLFFQRYAARIAYVLAGAHAVWWMRQNEAPWDHAPSDEIFKFITVKDEARQWAIRQMEQKPLLRDPLVRDCARLSFEWRRHRTARLESKLNTLCPRWKQNPEY